MDSRRSRSRCLRFQVPAMGISGIKMRREQSLQVESLMCFSGKKQRHSTTHADGVLVASGQVRLKEMGSTC